MLFTIKITYCAVWHYTDRAVSLMADLIKQYEPEIESITLVPSDGGRFEVEANGRLVYSKLASHRHADPGEVLQLFDKLMKEGN